MLDPHTAAPLARLADVPADHRPVWLELTPAAAYLGIGSRRLLPLAKEGAFPVYRAGTYVRFRRADLDAWRAENMPSAPSLLEESDVTVSEPDVTEEPEPPEPVTTPKRRRPTGPRTLPRPPVQRVWSET